MAESSSWVQQLLLMATSRKNLGVYSKSYQWLPAEFLVDKMGKVKVASYINSLPIESGLHPLIAEVFQLILPMFTESSSRSVLANLAYYFSSQVIIISRRLAYILHLKFIPGFSKDKLVVLKRGSASGGKKHTSSNPRFRPDVVMSRI